MSGTFARIAILLVGIVSSLPAAAAELTAEEAKRFVVGKLFAYNCFEGTNGAGRIFADGSVAGSIRIGGNGPVRYVVLPAGTLRVKGDSICASLRGLPFDPCFNVEQTSPNSFRGSIRGFSFAYCTFTRRSARADLANTPLRLQPLRSTAVMPAARVTTTASAD